MIYSNKVFIKNSIRSYFREIFLNVVGLLSKPSQGIHILNSHFTSRLNPNYERYCEFLHVLSSECDLVQIEIAIDLIKRQITTSDCLVSLTYDDGFEECHSIIAPALEEFKTNAAFFINGNFLNGDLAFRENFTNNVIKTPGKSPMTWIQIKELHDHGHIIGSHTLDHINMNSKDSEFIERQLSENKQLIENCTGHSCEYFAFPFGKFMHINNETLYMAEKYHKYIFSSTNNRNYYSFGGRVINRRHIESEWPLSHIKYFLSTRKTY
jgi:peptidoglycan/xylan/chitin deacetylase (PgdA/CDA1 family)